MSKSNETKQYSCNNTEVRLCNKGNKVGDDADRCKSVLEGPSSEEGPNPTPASTSLALALSDHTGQRVLIYQPLKKWLQA